VCAKSRQLKDSFNKSGQSWFPAPEVAHRAAQAANENEGRVMASPTSATLSPPKEGRDREAGLLAEIRAFWQLFFVRAFDPYRPELHYMRGPGPACRAKQRTLSPAVQSMVAEIRAAKVLGSSRP
jgi:hypothetical protein